MCSGSVPQQAGLAGLAVGRERESVCVCVCVMCCTCTCMYTHTPHSTLTQAVLAGGVTMGRECVCGGVCDLQPVAAVKLEKDIGCGRLTADPRVFHMPG